MLNQYPDPSLHLVLAVFLSLSILPQASAQTASSLESSSNSSSDTAATVHSPGYLSSTVTFTPPQGGSPKGTRSGGSRGDIACRHGVDNTNQGFVALLPDSGYGLTVSERPTLFAHVPATSAPKLMFLLKDSNDKIRYRTMQSVPPQGGIVQVTLPKTAPGLQIGQDYQWGLVLLCSGKLKPDSPLVSGLIRRVEPTPPLTARLNLAPSLQRAALYGAKGLWYDTLKTVADLKRSQPKNAELQSTWKNLLDSVGLNAIATAPLAP